MNKRHFILSSLISILCLNLPLYAWIIEIPKEAETIQEGVGYASTGDTLMVDPGIYLENIDYQGKDIVILGFAGPSETFLQPADPDLPAVSIIRNEGMGAEFTGFTVSGGGYSHTIFIDSGATPYIHNNIFHNNIAANVYDKAVIASWSDSSFPVIARNTFYDNNGLTCVWIQKGKGNIINNTMDGNRAAIMCNTELAVVFNNIIGNSAGIAIEGSFAILDYNNLWFNGSDYG